MLLAGRKLEISGKRNARYDLPDMYRALLSVCCRDGGASSMEGRYLRSKIRDGDAKLSSRSLMFNILKVLLHDHMLIRCKCIVPVISIWKNARTESGKVDFERRSADSAPAWLMSAQNR